MIQTPTHIGNGILFSLKEEGNFAICDNLDELDGHYANWNKPETERQVLYGLIYMWHLKNWSHRSRE